MYLTEARDVHSYETIQTWHMPPSRRIVVNVTYRVMDVAELLNRSVFITSLS